MTAVHGRHFCRPKPGEVPSAEQGPVSMNHPGSSASVLKEEEAMALTKSSSEFASFAHCIGRKHKALLHDEEKEGKNRHGHKMHENPQHTCDVLMTAAATVEGAVYVGITKTVFCWRRKRRHHEHGFLKAQDTEASPRRFFEGAVDVGIMKACLHFYPLPEIHHKSHQDLNNGVFYLQ